MAAGHRGLGACSLEDCDDTQRARGRKACSLSKILLSLAKRPTILSRKPLPRLRAALYPSSFTFLLLCLFSQTLGLSPEERVLLMGKGASRERPQDPRTLQSKRVAPRLCFGACASSRCAKSSWPGGWVILGARVRPSGHGQRARQGTAGWLGARSRGSFSGVQLPHRKKGSRGNRGRRT